MEKGLDPFLTKLCDEVTTQEEKKGFFNTLVGNIRANTSLFDWSRDQLSNKIYGEEFITKLYNNKEIFNYIYETFSVSEVFRKKCDKAATDSLQEAEKYWNIRDYAKCKQHCSAAILRADTKERWGRDLCQKALLIRSKCLINVDKLDYAKRDVSMAIRQGVLRDSLKKDLKEIFETLKKSSNEDNANNILENKKVLPSLGTSSYMGMRESDEMGRYYVASKDVNIGENLIIEQPYSSYLVQSCFGTHCHHCFNRLEAPVGCAECSSVAFCSELCLEEAMSSYHKFECKYIQLFIGSGMAILCFVALRIVTQIGLQESLNIYTKYVSKTDNSLDVEISSKYDHESFFKLCSHEQDRSPEDYVHRVLVTFFLLKCLKNTFFEQNTLATNKNKSDLTSQDLIVWSLLLRSLQLLQFNAHQIMDNTNTTEIGYGLFPKTSMMNHQCAPNVNRLFYGKYMIIKALQPIAKGEMIGDSYGPQWGRSLKGGSGQKREERRRILSSRYWFFCKCITCCQNWPTPPPDVPYVKCPNNSCDGNIISKITLSCTRCDKSADKQYFDVAATTLHTCIENIKDSMKLENVVSKINALIIHLNNYWECTRMSCPVVIKAEDGLRTAYSKILSKDNLTLQ